MKFEIRDSLVPENGQKMGHLEWFRGLEEQGSAWAVLRDNFSPLLRALQAPSSLVSNPKLNLFASICLDALKPGVLRRRGTQGILSMPRASTASHSHPAVLSHSLLSSCVSFIWSCFHLVSNPSSPSRSTRPLSWGGVSKALIYSQQVILVTEPSSLVWIWCSLNGIQFSPCT